MKDRGAMGLISDGAVSEGRALRVFALALTAALVFLVLSNAARAGAQETVAGDAKAVASDAGEAASERAGSVNRVAITISNGEETTIVRRGQLAANTQSTGQADDVLAEEAEISDSDTNGTVDRVVIEAAANCDLEVQDDATVVIQDENGAPNVTLRNTENDFEVVGGELIITGPDGGDIVADNIADLDEGTGTVISSLDISCGDNGGTIQNDATSEAQEDICSGGRVVAAFEDDRDGRGRTEAFEIEGKKFIVRFETAVEDKDKKGSTRITVVDDGGDAVESETAEEGDDGRIEVDAGPGDFFLRIDNENQDYEIDVVDCTGSTKSDVIKSTIPKKTLANTGGPALWTMAAGLVLAAGGLLLRASLRRGP